MDGSTGRWGRVMRVVSEFQYPYVRIKSGGPSIWILDPFTHRPTSPPTYPTATPKRVPAHRSKHL